MKEEIKLIQNIAEDFLNVSKMCFKEYKIGKGLEYRKIANNLKKELEENNNELCSIEKQI